ncbi:MAG: LysR family transcriptional regulator [Gemmatimonadaceae bacterium]|nr:LysR family transcriptional regulator [Acetobacteraceae bacterium]
MARRPPLASLRVFEAAARLASFRAASAELNLTPSAVSHAVKGLEQELGIALFVRERQRVTPTPAGETLLHHVARGFADLRRGLEAVCLTGPQSLRLHCAPSFAGQWLMPRLSRFLAANAGLDLRLSADPHYPVFPSDTFDADILYGELRQPGLTVIPLGAEPIVPLCAPSLAPQIGSATSLRGLVLIESEHCRLRWPHWFEANGIAAPAPRGPRFDRSSMSLAAAVDGMGVALDSTRLAERELLDGRLVMPLAGRSRNLSYVGHRLVFPAGADRKPPLARFAAWLQAELHLDGAGR